MKAANVSKMNEYVIGVYGTALTANLAALPCLANSNSMNIALDDLLKDLWR